MEGIPDPGGITDPQADQDLKTLDYPTDNLDYQTPHNCL
jgi:hypothetical protein